MSIKQIAERTHAIATAHGFHPPEEPADVYFQQALNNLHGEVSELNEAWRKGTLHSPCDKADKMDVPLTCLEEELADVILRTFDVAEKLGVDIQRAVEVKSRFNETRPFRHGNKKS